MRSNQTILMKVWIKRICLSAIVVLQFCCTEKTGKVVNGKLSATVLIDRRENDSLFLLAVFDRALAFSSKKTAKPFGYNFEARVSGNANAVTAHLQFGNLFQRHRQHLLVRLVSSERSLINILILENGKFRKVVESEYADAIYINDPLRDVNGNGLMDLVVFWHPPPGCCPEENCTVYVYNPANGDFADAQIFNNASFFPGEKVIRGLEYGHAGEAGLYKYVWNGAKATPVEFVYPYIDHKGMFIKTKIPAHYPTEEDGEVLKRLPAEYEKINSAFLNWFLSADPVTINDKSE
ncbi:MAG: hypothetical protein ABS85_10935 [Sphingobacteriales bacterium SCN 48-20]|nr:MAG: hypothetical protein ABS85_10935 [Sphingobacteriales bacterium SCN 48-20]OJW40236.1 MAG: hypothetical protein BGO56_09250 [Sphingobacteriales bacterium 48-107]